MSEPNPGANLCRSDPLLMLADVTRLVAEHWGGDEALIRAIYEHQIATTGRQPTLQQARDYLGYLTTSIDSVTLRSTLGLPPIAAAVFETVAPPSPVPDRRRCRVAALAADLLVLSPHRRHFPRRQTKAAGRSVRADWAM